MDLENRVINLERAVITLKEALQRYGTLIERTNKNLIRLGDELSKFKEETK